MVITSTYFYTIIYNLSLFSSNTKPPCTQKYYSASLKTVATGSRIASEIYFPSLLGGGRYIVLEDRRNNAGKKKKRTKRKFEGKEKESKKGINSFAKMLLYQIAKYLFIFCSQKCQLC